MERIRSLDKYQKAVIVFMLILVAVYAVIYPVTMAKEGYLYFDEIMIPHQENGNTVYSGNIEGDSAAFTVTGDKAVTFQYRGKTYGPYTAKRDAAAIPAEYAGRQDVTGLELYRGEALIFRGGVYKLQDMWWFVNADGSYADSGIVTIIGNGIVTDEKGNVIDTMEPSLSTVWNLMEDPELQHKGDWGTWVIGLLICLFTAASILFADELFRMSLMFKVYNVDKVEPSDWEIFTRYVTWTLLPIAAWVMFAVGLK